MTELMDMTGIHYLAHFIHGRLRVETNCSRRSNLTYHLHEGGGGAMNSGKEGLKIYHFVIQC